MLETSWEHKGTTYQFVSYELFYVLFVDGERQPVLYTEDAALEFRGRFA